MKIIELRNIGKRFNLPAHFTALNENKSDLFYPKSRQQYFWALRDINLDIDRGEIAGIVGRNGSGKTTLLKIVAGLIQPTEGTPRTDGRICSLFTLGSGFQDKLSGKENIFLNASLLGISDMEIKRKYRRQCPFR